MGPADVDQTPEEKTSVPVEALGRPGSTLPVLSGHPDAPPFPQEPRAVPPQPAEAGNTGCCLGAGAAGQDCWPGRPSAGPARQPVQAAVTGKRGPGLTRPWGVSTSSSFGPVSIPRWMRTSSAWGPGGVQTTAACLLDFYAKCFLLKHR